MRRSPLLLLVLAACPRPRPAAPPEGDTSAPPPSGPPATVLFLDSAGRAVPLACAAPGVGLYPDPGQCVELLGDDRTIGDLGQGRRKLGDESPWFCASSDTRRRAFKIDAAPGQAFAPDDPANDLIMWPAARGFDAAVWTREADLPPPDDAVAAAWAEAAAGMHGGAGLTAADARLYGTLTVDLDGDGTADALYSVGPAGAGPHAVIASLSRQQAPTVLLADDVGAVQAYAAIDLDGDGTPEIVIAAPTADGDWTAVYRFVRGALVSTGGIGC